MIERFGIGCACATALVLAGSAPAGEGDERTLADILETSSENVRLYNEHVVTLANPVMEGRVPGSRGMELAKEYCEFWFRDAGLTPPFAMVEKSASGTEIVTEHASWRFPFELGGELELKSELLRFSTADEDVEFEPGIDFAAQGLGGSNDVTAPLVFVGYSIEEGPDGYSSYAEGDDLTGKIAMMFRFEPMDEEGVSLWSHGAPWSGKAGFEGKLRAAKKRGAEAIIVVNTPGADDPRAATLPTIHELGGGRGDKPVLIMAPEGAERLVQAAGWEGSLLDLRANADEGGALIEFEGSARVAAEIDIDALIAENVAGVLPGRGGLEDEYIVIGAHLDHLGLGYFGSRGEVGKLHPGADDNASGSAGVLLLAKTLSETYAETPEDVPLRSIMFMCFSGEESGLNGSRAYVDNPLVPVEQHYAMINFDMIGRIKEGRVNVGGSDTAIGMRELLEPLYEASGLTVSAGKGLSGASDHSSFYAQEIPVLFGAITDFHKDYHTPEDLSWKINRIDAVTMMELFHDIAFTLASNDQPLEFAAVKSQGRGGGLGGVKVRFGVMPDYNELDMGVGITGVTPGGSADEAGVQDGDILIRWDGQKIDGIEAWMGMLGNHKPGDKIKIGVKRDGKELTLDVTLQSR